MDSAREVAGSRRCSVVSPAGCGKTYLIAYAVTHHGGGRELVLTHTHAGVDALRRRLRQLGAPSGCCAVDTIAGWALRLAAAFPGSSGLRTTKPTNNEEWNCVYSAAWNLLGRRPIQRVLKASYSGVYVDEYQDCALHQHRLVTGLAECLPCRVLGDPLQSIFGFREDAVVAWDKDVTAAFDAVAGPTEPWRWKLANPALGAWLLEIRNDLLAGRPVDVSRAPAGLTWRALGEPKWQMNNQRDACFAARVGGDSAVAIRSWSAQGHRLARSLGGVFSCVEPIDAKELFNFAREMDCKVGHERAVALIDFASDCMTKVGSSLATVRKALEAGRATRSSKCPEQQAALQNVVTSDGMGPVLAALDSLAQVTDAKVVRRELLIEARRTLHAMIGHEHACVHDAAWEVRSRTRRIGRPMAKRAFGTTLLVKGLEFDHAVVLDADEMNANNLYVALTRGAKTLTVVSKSRIITPKTHLK